VLEVFVHLTLEARAMRFLLYEITLPGRARLRRHGEDASHHPHASASRQEAGSAWLDDGTALALVVPSVIVPQEANYVLNTRHTQFAQLRVAGPEPFSFDERLWQCRSAGE
jgi:RES domain-containing protein